MANVEVSIDEIVNFIEGVQNTEFLDKALWESIGEQLKIQTEKRFNLQIDPDGNPWASLSSKYGASKLQKATHNKILQFGGGLLDTLHSQATDYGVKFGSNKIYSATHQFGRAEDGIVARPFLGLNDEDKIAVLEELQEAWQVWVDENT